VRASLAEHESSSAASTPLRLPAAASARFEGCSPNYPAYDGRDRALLYLGLAYRKQKKLDEAQAAFSRLREEHPQSRWVAEIPPEAS
jgi:outer membrane protein assembly factor BamD (BamD/ComL family)